MKIYTDENLTDEEIRKEMRRTTLVSVGVACAIALGIDARTANGTPPSDHERRDARDRVAEVLNARNGIVARLHQHQAKR